MYNNTRLIELFLSIVQYIWNLLECFILNFYSIAKSVTLLFSKTSRTIPRSMFYMGIYTLSALHHYSGICLITITLNCFCLAWYSYFLHSKESKLVSNSFLFSLAFSNTCLNFRFDSDFQDPLSQTNVFIKVCYESCFFFELFVLSFCGCLLLSYLQIIPGVLTSKATTNHQQKQQNNNKQQQTNDNNDRNKNPLLEKNLNYKDTIINCTNWRFVNTFRIRNLRHKQHNLRCLWYQ